MATAPATAPHPKIAPHIFTKEERYQITTSIKQGYRPSNVMFAGFSVTDIRNYMFGVNSGKVGLAEAESVIRAALGMKQTKATTLAGALIPRSRISGGPGGPGWGSDITWGLHHLAEHPAGSHYHGDFNIATAINAAVGVFTLGTMPNITSFLSGLGKGQFDLGKIQFNVPFSGAHINDLSHDIVDLYTGQQLSDQASPILDSKIARYVDTGIGAAAGIITGTAAYSFGSLAAAAPGAGAGAVGESAGLVGVTEASLAAKNAPAVFEIGEAANYTRAGVTAASLESVGGSGLLAGIGEVAMNVGKFLGTTISAAYVQKLIGGGGKVLQDVLHGNLSQAGSDLVDTVNPVGSGSNPQKPTGGGGFGGGGGGGYMGGGGVAQSSLLSLLLPVGLIAVVLILLAYLYKRKR